MPLEKLPVPEIQLQTSDYGTVFQQKMNDAIAALRTAIIAYNNQIDAALTAADFTQIATAAEMVAGTNNTKRVTPRRVKDALDARGLDRDLGPAAYRGVTGSGDLMAIGYSGLGADFLLQNWNLFTGSALSASATNSPLAGVVIAGFKSGSASENIITNFAGRHGRFFGRTYGANNEDISWYEFASTKNTLLLGPTPATARSTLQLGTAALFNVGLRDGEIPQAQMFGDAAWEMKSALLNRANHTGTQPLSTISGAGAAASRGVTGTGNLMAVGYRGVGGGYTTEAWGADSGGGFIGSAANGPHTDTTVAGFKSGSLAGALTNFGARHNRFFGQTIGVSNSNPGAAWYEFATTFNTLLLGTTPANARNVLELKNMATRNLTVSTSAPTAAQIEAMAEGDLWGVYS